jgi:hypothetical protein
MAEALLGEIEQLVLLAVLRLDGEAGANPVRDLIQQDTGMKLFRGSVYVTLERLERKGLVADALKKMLDRGKAPNAADKRIVALLQAWHDAGGSRRDADRDGKIDDPGVPILDAAWKGLTDAGLCDRLGTALCKQLEGRNARFDQPPGGQYGGWHQYMWKDLRAMLGQKVAGEQARVFKTTAGKIAQMQTQLGNLAESFGKPLIEPMGALADAFREVFIAMGPVADEFADKLGPEVHKFSQWLIDNKAAIIEWAKWAADWVLWLGQKFVVSLQDTYAQWQPVWANLKHDWEYLSTSWNMIVENIKSGAAAAWTGVTEIWNQAREYFTKLIEDIKKLFEPLYESIIKPFKDAYDYLIKLWPNLGGSAAGGAGGGAAATAPVAASSGARQAEDYVAPWQQTGPPTAPAAPGTVADLPTTPAVATAVVNEKIAAERARVMKQLQEPGMRELTAAVVAKEQSGVGGKTDVLEALVNRSVVTGKHPRDLIRGGFYGPVNRGEVDALLKRGLSASQLQEYDVASGAVGAGSNRIRGRTDQGMYNEIKGERLKSEGEYYGMMGLKGEKQTEAYKATLQQATQAQAKAPLAPGPLRTDASVPAGSRLKDMIKEMNIQQRVSGATGGQNIAMNAPITVNGVAPGRESLMARQTALALRDPTAQLLTGIKKAQRQESRLGYV